jgi:hypothetical protein
VWWEGYRKFAFALKHYFKYSKILNPILLENDIQQLPDGSRKLPSDESDGRKFLF